MLTNCAPENTNLLNPNEWRFYIARAPYLTFFVQTVAVPSINLLPAETNNPFVSIQYPGDHLDFEPLSVNFLVDENLSGWREVYNWMTGLGFPESFEQYEQAVKDRTFRSGYDEVTKSDISLITNTGSRVANLEFLFRDAWPTMLSAPTFSTTNDGQPVVTAKVSFTYTDYIIRPAK